MFKENFDNALRLVKEANTNKQQLISTPSMLTPEEQKFLYLLAKDYYTGEGAIFDSGICLGGCTESFARGLAARPTLTPVRPIIWAYELGMADEDYVSEFIRNAFGEERHKGDSFVDIIQKNIDSMPCRDSISFFPGDIREQPYPESIEIMFLDVCKTQEINFKMQQLFSRLIPGKSLVLQQDYVHAWHPYIHTTMGYLAEYFEPVGYVAYSTFAFLLKKAIPQEVLDIDIYNSASVEKLEGLLTRYYSYFPTRCRNHMEMARAMLLFEKGEHEKCRQFVVSMCERSELPWDFEHICEHLGLGALVRDRRNAKHPEFPMKLPNLSEQRLQEIRRFIFEKDSCSQSKTSYQDNVLFFLRNNAFRGDNIVEVGCYKGGLTAQYAYLCKELGKRLYVVDVDKDLLEHTEKIVKELGYADVVSYHLMDYETFTATKFFPNKTIATIIDADHSYIGCLKDCRVLQKVLPAMYGVIFHDFTLRYLSWDGVGVDRAIYEVFGQNVRLYPIGFQSVCSETPTPEEAYLAANEGVVMVVPWQPDEVFGQKEKAEEVVVSANRYDLCGIKQIIKGHPVVGPIATKIWKTLKK